MLCWSRPSLVLRLSRLFTSIEHHVFHHTFDHRQRRGIVHKFPDISRRLTTPKYPLSSIYCGQPNQNPPPYLDPAYQHGSSLYTRPQIVSPKLCEDVLAYLKPLLEQYKGCDVLDLNPGLGLWSQTLHDFLQPRTHVLLESSSNIHDQYLQPLVDKPGSTYKLFHGKLGQYSIYEDLVKQGAFPYQTLRKAEDAGGKTLNTSLLVTGTIMWQPQYPGEGFSSYGKQLSTRFMKSAWRNEQMHMFGPVRSLLWMTQEDFKGCLPRSQFLTSKFSALLESLGQYTQIVTPRHPPRRSGRSTTGRGPHIELEGIVRAMQRGRKAGIVLPVHRRENVHDFAEDIERLSGGTGVMDRGPVHDYLKEQEELGKSTTGLIGESAIAFIRADAAWKLDFEKHGRPGAKTPRSKAYQPHNRLRATYTRNHKLRLHTSVMSGLGVQIHGKESEILTMEEGNAKQKALEQLANLQKIFESQFYELPGIWHSQVFNEIDDMLSIRGPVPCLQWDHRPFEPLVMQPEEVWPRTDACLVLCEPQPTPSEGDTGWLEYYQGFTFGLYEQNKTSVETALEKIQLGASEIVSQVPSLTDPSKGGRLDMKQLRTRMLTVEMSMDLWKAYNAWPFRSADAYNSKIFTMRYSKHLRH